MEIDIQIGQLDAIISIKRVDMDVVGGDPSLHFYDIDNKVSYVRWIANTVMALLIHY